MKEKLKSLKLFNEIDFAFADYLLEIEDSNSEELYLATLCVSYSATLQHSALSLHEANGKTINEFCSDRKETSIYLDFSNFKEWPQKYNKTVGLDGEKKPLILDLEQGILYLNKYFYAEKKVAEFIKHMSEPLDISDSVLSQLNLLFQSDLKPDWQKVAAYTALRSRFCVISGGPGTGKTTTVAKILALLLQQNVDLRIDLLAPTGKAADRLGEAIVKVSEDLVSAGVLSTEISQGIPKKASTIHRYLGTRPGSKSFVFNEKNKTASDIVLVDESSMVSLPLFHSLLKALNDDCRLILLGDKDQLTAVETGNVLGELTCAEHLNTFSQEFCEAYENASQMTFDYVSSEQNILQDLVLKLEHSYRFGADSPVGRLAELINEPAEDLQVGHFMDVFTEAQPGQEYVSFTEIPESLDRQSIKSFESINSYFERYKKLIHSDDTENVLKGLVELRILTATRVGSFGAENINREISRTYFQHDDNDLYHGRCIMITSNDHSLELFNGDVGVILLKDGMPAAYFPSKEGDLRSFSPSILPDFETAFAMTIHKSQGSEYSQVIMILPDSELVTRQLVYTGITRARKSVEVVADMRTLFRAAKNNSQRFSGLRKRLS